MGDEEGYGAAGYLLAGVKAVTYITAEFHGVSEWPTRICLCLSLTLNGFAHAFCIHYTVHYTVLPPAFVVVVRCKVIAVLSPGAIMPHLSTERYDISTVQHTTTQYNTKYFS